MKIIMRKILTFNEFKNRLNDIDKQISAQEEFIKSSDAKKDGIQINYYMCIILHLKVQKNELLNNPRYLKYVEKLKKENVRAN